MCAYWPSVHDRYTPGGANVSVSACGRHLVCVFRREHRRNSRLHENDGVEDDGKVKGPRWVDGYLPKVTVTATTAREMPTIMPMMLPHGRLGCHRRMHVARTRESSIISTIMATTPSRASPAAINNGPNSDQTALLRRPTTRNRKRQATKRPLSESKSTQVSQLM